MSREIKFRAWNGQRMYDCEVISGNTGYETWMEFEDGIGTDIIMQFTGLKDKNDKDIYEGDIFQNKYIVKDLISLGEYQTSLIRCDGTDISNFEVIGNIYEDPKLLEKKEE